MSITEITQDDDSVEEVHPPTQGSPNNSVNNGAEVVNNGAQEEVEEELDEENLFQKRKRRRTSVVWTDFKEVIMKSGEKKAVCKWCKKPLVLNARGSTSTMLRHLSLCTQKQLTDKKQKRLVADKAPNEPLVCASNFVYDHAKVREAAAHMVLVHEYPFNHMEHEVFNIFMRKATPYWQKISRTTSKQDCVTTYETEKRRLKALLKTVKRISITTDCWKSGQDIEYMVITGHFVDNWKLHKRILNFVHVPPPCNGVVIADAIYKRMEEWGIEKKVATITVDNTSYNDVAVRTLKDNFELKKKLLCGGKLFHVRCAAHIINLLVQDGLKEIQHIIEKVRKSVKYLANSEARLIKFSEIAKQLQIPMKKLILDCLTRWNSTYAMLAAALVFKDVFPRYKTRDPSYDHLPSSEDWEKADVICDFLGVFDQVTTLISGSDYPTSNMFLAEVCSVHGVLKEKLLDDKPYIQAMALKMMEKFDKYWGECNILMAIGVVLDPRYKLMLVEYCFSDMYSGNEVSRNVDNVRDALVQIYNEYVVVHTNSNNVPSSALEKTISTNTSNGGKSVISVRSKFDSYVRRNDSIQPLKSELDVYLEEGVYICDGSDESQFCALEWWKANYLKYRILSKMACDILSIPITTVASESAFSAGGRVIDTYRASLSTETVQVLMCGADWVRNLHGIKRSRKIVSDDTKEIILP